jgi:hypothetical protein
MGKIDETALSAGLMLTFRLFGPNAGYAKP